MTLNPSPDAFDPRLITNWVAKDEVRAAAAITGFKSNDPESRKKALYAYGGAFEQIGIHSVEALLAAANLVEDAVPEIRALARQTLIGVSSRYFAVPALPKLFDVLQKTENVEEARDLGRAIGCIARDGIIPEAIVDRLNSLIVQGDEAQCIGAARAAGVIISRCRGYLAGVSSQLGVVLSVDSPTIRGEELLRRVRHADSASSGQLASHRGIDLDITEQRYRTSVQFMPTLLGRLSNASPAVAEQVTEAIRHYEADCADAIETLSAFFECDNRETRAHVFEALSYCTDEIKARGDQIVGLLYGERYVMALEHLMTAICRCPHATLAAKPMLQALASLEPNEAQLEADHPGHLAFGSGFVAGQAARALMIMDRKIAEN